MMGRAGMVRWSVKTLGSMLPVLGLFGCFQDSSVPLLPCVEGASTCPCRATQTPCNQGLECDAQENVCRSQRCEDGREGCSCTDDGRCLTGLTCIENSCIAMDDGTSSSTTSVPTTADVTSSAGSGEDTGTDPEPATTSVEPCGCGWAVIDDATAFYACGIGLPFEDETMVFPRECPEDIDPIPGGPCQGVTLEGCCAGPFSVFCIEDMLVIDDCELDSVCTP